MRSAAEDATLLVTSALAGREIWVAVQVIVAVDNTMFLSMFRRELTGPETLSLLLLLFFAPFDEEEEHVMEVTRTLFFDEMNGRRYWGVIPLFIEEDGAKAFTTDIVEETMTAANASKMEMERPLRKVMIIISLLSKFYLSDAND